MAKAPPTNLVGISVTLSVACYAQIQLKGVEKLPKYFHINKLRRPAGPGEQRMCVVCAVRCTNGIGVRICSESSCLLQYLAYFTLMDYF